jgi:hypothetical protein
MERDRLGGGAHPRKDERGGVSPCVERTQNPPGQLRVSSNLTSGIITNRASRLPAWSTTGPKVEQQTVVSMGWTALSQPSAEIARLSAARARLRKTYRQKIASNASSFSDATASHSGRLPPNRLSTDTDPK